MPEVSQETFYNLQRVFRDILGAELLSNSICPYGGFPDPGKNYQDSSSRDYLQISVFGL